MLLGYKPLPWEANPAMISQHVHSPAAGRLIRHLLQYVLCLLTACYVLVSWFVSKVCLACACSCLELYANWLIKVLAAFGTCCASFE